MAKSLRESIIAYLERDNCNVFVFEDFGIVKVRSSSEKFKLLTANTVESCVSDCIDAFCSEISECGSEVKLKLFVGENKVNGSFAGKTAKGIKDSPEKPDKLLTVVAPVCSENKLNLITELVVARRSYEKDKTNLISDAFQLKPFTCYEKREG